MAPLWAIFLQALNLESKRQLRRSVCRCIGCTIKMISERTAHQLEITGNTEIRGSQRKFRIADHTNYFLFWNPASYVA